MYKFNFSFKIILFLIICFSWLNRMQIQGVQPSPDQVASVQSVTTVTTPVYTSSVATAPISTPPVDTGSVTVAPISTPPVDTGSVTVAPISTPPVDTDSVTALVYTPPIDTTSTVVAPVFVLPTATAPAYAPPVAATPIATIPAYAPPIIAAPVATALAAPLASVVATQAPTNSGTATQGSTVPSSMAQGSTPTTLATVQSSTPVVSTTPSVVTPAAASPSVVPSATTQANFTAALSIATTPGELNTVVNTQAYNSVTYLVDYPVGAGIFSKISGFFSNGVTNQTGQAVIDLQTLLSNPNLNNFLSSQEQQYVANWLTSLTNVSSLALKSMFTTALASASTPSTVNTIVNTQAYNSVNYLVDYPSATNSIFTKIQGFFNASGVPNVTGQAVIDLQSLLSNPNLNNFLSSTEQPTVANWLANVTNATNVVITQNENAFAAALNRASTPSAINAMVNTYAPTVGAASNSVAYLVDYPSTTNSIFTKIQGFFNASGVPNITGQALIDLLTLLNNVNLNNFLSSIEQQTVAIWLANVTTALSKTVATPTTSVVQSSTATSQVQSQKASQAQVAALAQVGQATMAQANFNMALMTLGATPTPAAIGTLIPKFSTSPYAPSLVDYPSSTTGLFSKIGAFFTNNAPNVTGTTLAALQTLLSNGIPPYAALNPNLIFLLSATEQATAAAWLKNVNTAVNAANTAATVAPVTTSTSTATATVTQANFNMALMTLGSSPTPAAIGTLVTKLGPTADASSLVDYPSSTTGLFSKIGAFFTNNAPNVTGTTLAALQTLLSNGIPPYAALNPNLIFLLSATEQATAAAWLKNVNTAVNAANTAATTTATSVATSTIPDSLSGSTAIMPQDAPVLSAISIAMASSGISNQVAALNLVAVKANAATNTTSFSSVTQNAFAAAIMNVGGSYINTNVSALTAFYNTIKAKTTLTISDKTNIKSTIAPYITSVGGNIANFAALLTNSLKTNLLTGPVATSGTQMYFVNTVLISAVNMLVYLSNKSS
jgi:hypothetical protein